MRFACWFVCSRAHTATGSHPNKQSDRHPYWLGLVSQARRIVLRCVQLRCCAPPIAFPCPDPDAFGAVRGVGMHFCHPLEELTD